jgi:hypothetical protein
MLAVGTAGALKVRYSRGVVVVVSIGVIHNVVLSALKPATRYYYVCGGGSAWSAQFSFVTLPSADSPG